MAVTADSVVVELEAKVDGYQAAISGAARTTDTAMSSIERSAGQAEASMRGSLAKIEESGNRAGASQQILQSIVRRTTDQFAAGAPISVILAEHLSGVAEAGALAGGKLGALGEFLGGPWGIAVSAAVSILSILIAKFADAEKGAKKQKDAIDLLRDALVAYAKANGQAVSNAYVEARLTEDATRAFAAKEAAIRRVTIAQIEATKAQLERDKADTTSPDANRQFRIVGATNALPGLEKILAEQNKKVEDAERRARVASGARIELDNAADPTGKDPIAAAAAKVKAAQNAYAVTLANLEHQLANREIDEKLFSVKQAAAENARDAAVNADANQRKDDAEQRKREAAERRAERAAESAANKELREAARAAAEAERQRVKALNELSTYSREFNTKFERQMASDNRTGLSAFEKDQDRRQQGAIDAGEEFRKKQADNIKSLADLYETAFTKGGQGIADAFKSAMTRAIAESLAKLTVSKLSNLTSGSGILGALGGLFGGFSSSRTYAQINSGIANLPTAHFASGGYVGAGQLVSVNEAASPGNPEFFQPQGSGKIIPLGQTRAAMGGGGNTVLQTFHLDLKGSVLTSDLIEQMNAIGDAAAQRGAAGGSAMAQATISRRNRYRLGA